MNAMEAKLPSNGETLLEKLDRCPPFACYYAAHRGLDKRPTISELASKAGISYRTILRIRGRTSWSGVTTSHVSRFCHACGVDPLDPKPVLEWLATRMASGLLEKDLNGPKGQGRRILAGLNLLAAKSVMK